MKKGHGNDAVVAAFATFRAEVAILHAPGTSDALRAEAERAMKIAEASMRAAMKAHVAALKAAEGR